TPPRPAAHHPPPTPHRRPPPLQPPPPNNRTPNRLAQSRPRTAPIRPPRPGRRPSRTLFRQHRHQPAQTPHQRHHQQPPTHRHLTDPGHRPPTAQPAPPHPNQRQPNPNQDHTATWRQRVTPPPQSPKSKNNRLLSAAGEPKTAILVHPRQDRAHLGVPSGLNGLAHSVVQQGWINLVSPSWLIRLRHVIKVFRIATVCPKI